MGGATPDGRRFVVVSGLPGAGKSTLGRLIAESLALEFIDKDDFLEQLLDDNAEGAALRSQLSREADHLMRAAAENSDGAVLVSFWRREEVSKTSGTPADWLRTLPNVVEMFCACPPEVAAERFLARTRHAGHGDTARDPDELLHQLTALAALGPIGLATVVRVDTERAVDVAAVVAELDETLAGLRQAGVVPQ
jgi:adenylate kinase family enzyme